MQIAVKASTGLDIFIFFYDPVVKFGDNFEVFWIKKNCSVQ